jgi:hypothetical protein
MYFNSAYSVVGSIDVTLLEEIIDQINKNINSRDYTYHDVDSKTKLPSWSRVDFSHEPTDERLIPLYKSILRVISEFKKTYRLNPISNISISVLQPLQTLEEHTDGRFIHRITDRFLIPLMKSDVNYNYGYINNQKVIYPLEYGKIFRINNAIIHSALNLENQERYNILIDTFDTRLREKFANHPDLYKGLTVLGVNKHFEMHRKPQVRKNIR